MGLLHAFVNWGIRLIDNTDTDVRRIGQRFGFMPLSWRQVVMTNPTKDGLVWRVPDPDVRMAASFMSTQGLLVSENEMVMLLKNGRLEVGTERGVLLAPGLYDVSHLRVRDQMEVIWMSAKEIRLRWGVSDVLTQDRISIGVHGYYTTKIKDPEAFYFSVVGNAQVYKEEQLQSFTKTDVNSLLREQVARRTVMEFQTARREFFDAAREVLQPTFERWGLEFLGLTIEGQNIPQQFLRAAAGRTIVTMEKEAQLEGAKVDVSLAQLEAQKAYFTAQIEAAKLRAIGQVNIELMQSQQSIGVNPLDVKRIEAIEAMALNPGEGTLVDNRPQLANQLLGPPGQAPTNASVMPVTTITGSIVPSNNGIALPSALSYNSGPLAPNTNSGPLTSATPGGSMTREKIQEMLEKLDERLIMGEITEQKHSELYDRLQKKLNELH
jgi:membrane protease subunit (stomatin/prohibitin family)